MANTYAPTALGIKPPKEGFQQGGWYQGRQYWDGTLSDPNVIHPSSNQQGAGAAVSAPVVAASDVAQGLAPGTNKAYLAGQIKNAPVVPGSTVTPGSTSSVPSDLQKQIDSVQGVIDSKKKSANEAIANVNENPFLSEGNRVGRVQKINTNLTNSLLVDESQLKILQDKVTALAPEPNVTSETDDQGNVWQVITDKKTGAIISKTNLGKIGKATKATTESITTTKANNRAAITQGLYSQTNSYGNVSPEVFTAARDAWVADGLGTADDFIKAYGNLADPNRGDFDQTYGFAKDYRDKLFGI